MSYWTYIDGVVCVSPMGRTQPEKRYVLDTVLEHLPVVSGSEGNMNVYAVQKHGHNVSSTHNEFGEPLCYRSYEHNLHRTQSGYMVILEASLRDRTFEETEREFLKWISRLAKRVYVDKVLVRVSGQERELVLKDADPFSQMNEMPSWCSGSDGEPAWAEYLLWDTAKDSEYPLKLTYKYYNDPENDAEYERRLEMAGVSNG